MQICRQIYSTIQEYAHIYTNVHKFKKYTNKQKNTQKYAQIFNNIHK